MSTPLSWRSVGPGDTPDVHRLAAACDVADGSPFVQSVEDVQDILDGADLESGSFLAFDGDAPVAWGVVSHDPPDATDEPRKHDRIIMFGGVHPDRRRQGIGTELITRQLARATEIAATLPCPTDARMYGPLPDPGREALGDVVGMPATRWFEDLQRDLTPLDREPPAGIRITPWEPRHDEPARLLKNASFADHWGSPSTSSSAWQRDLESAAARRDLNLIAIDEDDTVIGLCSVSHWPHDAETVGMDAAWIDTLGTAAAWRGQGVASALIARAIERFRAAGLEGAMIGVDAASPSGANLLYRNLGFVSHSRSVCRLKQLTRDSTS